MASNKDDPGAGAGRPIEPPTAKRPYATIEIKATELGSGGTAPGGAGANAVRPGGRSGWMRRAAGLHTKAAAAVARAFQRLAVRVPLTHAAAGALGALIVLALTSWPWHVAPGGAPALPGGAPALQGGELSGRVGALEAALAARKGAPAGDPARFEELSQRITALAEAQANLARESKALAARGGADEGVAVTLQQRLARVEEGLASASKLAAQGQANGEVPARLAEVEGSVRHSSETLTAAITRFDAELAAARADAGRLAERLGALEQGTQRQLQGTARAADVDSLATRLSAVQQDLHAIVGSEAERKANASRLILTLELADVKRAADRGEGFAAELAQLKKTAGNSLNVAALERYMAEGAPTVQDLATSFPATASAMIDAEQAPPDASLWQRLLAGARSVVRIRRIGHAAGDNGTEAVIERMETALREGRLAEAVGYAENLSPKAAGAAADWMAKANARLAVDRALGDIQSALKDALADRSAASAGR